MLAGPSGDGSGYIKLFHSLLQGIQRLRIELHLVYLDHFGSICLFCFRGLSQALRCLKQFNLRGIPLRIKPKARAARQSYIESCEEVSAQSLKSPGWPVAYGILWDDVACY